MKYYTQTNKPVEFNLYPANPVTDETVVDVVFTGRDQEFRVPTFMTSDGIIKVRFSAPDPGDYSFRSESSPKIDGLDGVTGSVEIAPYGGDNPLYKHGAVRLSADRKYLEHQDGTPFLWTGDTWWTGLTDRLDWPKGFKLLTDDRVRKGFNLIQIVAGSMPNCDAEDGTWSPAQKNSAGWPWEQDWESINSGFYDLADLKIVHLVESGLMPCIVGMWGYYLTFMGVEKGKKHWRNLIARYGAYPVIWCLAGEVMMPTYSHHADKDAKRAEEEALKNGWSEVAQYLKSADPFHRVLTAHPMWCSGSRDMLLHESVLDVNMLQTSHGSFFAFSQALDCTLRNVTREPHMMVVNGEPSYEGILGSNYQDVQRFNYWTGMTSGLRGYTYGAQGIWDTNIRNDPSNPALSEWGEAYWDEAMHLPGSAQVGIGRRFFECYEWWQFEPITDPALAEVERTMSFGIGIPGELAIFYLPMTFINQQLLGVQALRLTLDWGASYKVTFFNPRNGSEIDGGTVTPEPDGKLPLLHRPTMEDWVLILERC